MAGVLGFYVLSLALWAWLGGRSFGLGLPFALTLGLAAAQVAWHGWLIGDRSREGCFRAFRANHWLGATLFAGVALDLLLRA